MRLYDKSFRELNDLINDYRPAKQKKLAHLTSNEPLHNKNVDIFVNTKSILEYRQLSNNGYHTTKYQPNDFNHVNISKLALLKISDHAKRGGHLEIIGILIGTTVDKHIVVHDVFEILADGTETRVNALIESYEYMVQYSNEMITNSKSNNHIVGWYHSHPGYGCWLSSIDIQTQKLNQDHQDPYVALVIDPIKSAESGIIEIGAFRTKPSLNKESMDTFFELPITIFDSEFNSCIAEKKLKYIYNKNDSNIESVFYKPLLEILTQRDSLIKISKISSSKKINQQNHSIMTSNNNDPSLAIYKSSTSTSSPNTSSDEGESDIDMIGDDMGDIESLISSVNQLREFTPSLSYSQRNTPIEQDELVTRNNTNEMFERSNPSKLVHKESGVIQKHLLELDYNEPKNRLLGMKLQEFKHLKLFRDAFDL